MTDRPAASDALVLFGLTGDLAHKMIFPALYAMVQRGVLTVPVVGVASRSWSLAQLEARVTDSVKQSGAPVEQGPLGRLLSLLQYVSGDYNNAETFAALKKAFGDRDLYAGLGTTLTLGAAPRSIAEADQNIPATMDEDDLQSYRALLGKSDDREYSLLARLAD